MLENGGLICRKRGKIEMCKTKGENLMDKFELFEALDEHLCRDGQPSRYLDTLENPDFENHPFTMLSTLHRVPQSPTHHPEGHVWNHTLLVVDEAAKRKSQATNPRVFMWAALLHDIGKAKTTRMRKGKITAYDHDKVGAEMAREFLECFEEEAFIGQVQALVRWHMQILFVVKDLPFADISGMLTQTNVEDVALLGLCDRLGRTGIDTAHESQNIKVFLEKVKAYR